MLAIAMIGVSLSAQASWDISKVFDVKAGGQLVLETEQGSIQVDTHDKNVVELLIDVTGFDEDDVAVDFDHDGSDINIDVDVKSNNSWGNRQLRFTILVPESYNLNLDTRGGSISTLNLKGGVEARTSGGSLRFENIVGNIDGHTSGGSVDVEDSEGNVKVRSSGGSIDIENVTGDVDANTSGGSVSVVNVGGNLETRTSGGSMKIENIAGRADASTSGGSIRARIPKQPRGDISLSTSGGSIKIKLAKDVRLSLNAKARKIRSDFKVDGKTEAKKRLSGDINGGGPTLEVRAHSGSITLDTL